MQDPAFVENDPLYSIQVTLIEVILLKDDCFLATSS